MTTRRDFLSRSAIAAGSLAAITLMAEASDTQTRTDSQRCRVENEASEEAVYCDATYEG